MKIPEKGDIKDQKARNESKIEIEIMTGIVIITMRGIGIIMTEITGTTMIETITGIIIIMIATEMTDKTETGAEIKLNLIIGGCSSFFVYIMYSCKSHK